MKKQIIYRITAVLLLLSPSLHAQMPGGSSVQRPSAVPPQSQEKLISQSFADAPLEMLVDFYNEWTGRTLIIQADLSPTITLKFSKLTKDEAMQAIETVLSMNGVALVPMGEKFLKVVPIASARQEGMEILPFDEEADFTASDQLISQIIPLRYIVFSDVQPVIQHLIHGYGKVIPMERINSVLVTDTSANVARIVEAIAMLDQPLEKIEPRIYQLKHATADEIAGKLKELVEAATTPASKQQQQTVAAARTIPGVIRAPKTSTSTSTLTGTGADETQMIQGEVKFVSDKRTNILIVFSKAANFDFFDNIIKVLDVPVDPEVVVETINLEYAEASEIAGILNDFVGAAQAEEEPTKAQAGEDTGGESRSINDVIARRSGQQQPVSTATESAIGRLSADTKIISDERTNSLILMGSKSDIAALKTVIASLDVMLQQVMIEVIILNVNVGDDFATGVDWVYEKGGVSGKSRQSFGPSLASGIATNLVGTAVKGATFKYLQTMPSLDTELLIEAAKSDSDTRILSTPIVMTTDNTEAKITVAKEQPVVTSSINSGSSGVNNSISARATYQYKTIGVELTVTPHINPQNFVLMEITQSADEIATTTPIDGNDVPVVSKREITATVGVKDRETIILGGLVSKNNAESSSKIPLLGDIPLLGWLFNYHNTSDKREELVVLLTPYVLNTPEEATTEARRRLESSDAKNTEWPRGWSLSELANDEPEADAWKSKKEKPEMVSEQDIQAIMEQLNRAE